MHTTLEIQLQIQRSIRHQLAIKAPAPDALDEAGDAYSLDIPALFRTLERTYDVELNPDTVLPRVHTIADLSRIIQEKTRQAG